MKAAAPRVEEEGRRRNAGPGRREGRVGGAARPGEEERPLPPTNGPLGGGEVRRIEVPQMERL